MLARCVAFARGSARAQSQCEANVARLAAMVMRPRFPDAATNLMAASADYFATHPTEQLPAEEVVRTGWVLSLPRMRDMLDLELRKVAANERS